MWTWRLLALALTAAPCDTRPPLADSERLPARADCYDNWKDAEKFDHELQDLAKSWPNSPHLYEWGAARREAQRLSYWWYHAEKSQSGNADTRRDHLDLLRAMSWRIYYSGDWPPSIPWWRLQRADR